MINNKEILDILVVGSGLSGMTFAEEYLKKNRKINIISPTIKSNNKNSLQDKFIEKKTLPPQWKKNSNNILNYFQYNNLVFNKKNCNILGSLEFGGISNYWGLQIDKNISQDLKNFKKKTQHNIKDCFKELIKEKKLIGSFGKYINDYRLNNFYENLILQNYSKQSHFFEKNLIGLSSTSDGEVEIEKNKKKLIKLNPDIIKKKFKNKIIFHNFVVNRIENKKNFTIVYCKLQNKTKIFKTKKLVLACGTIVTTKLMIDFLNIKKEVPIKHHSRLISAYIFKKKIKSLLDFTPSLIEVKQKKKHDYIADIRPANKTIIQMISSFYFFFKSIDKFLYFFKDYIIFSNILLNSKYSNLYIKKSKKVFLIFSKKSKVLNILKNSQKKIFNFLRFNNLIWPFYKNSYPGVGADYHYFGTIVINKKKKLSVNENCQLKNNNSIFIIDGSVFDFKYNFYPLGLIMANAKRIAKFLNK
jgi:hypothetical protein